MALISTIFCQVCQQHKTVTHSASSYPEMCNECKIAGEITAEDTYVNELRKLSLEQRIERLERTAYQKAREIPWDGRIG